MHSFHSFINKNIKKYLLSSFYENFYNFWLNNCIKLSLISNTLKNSIETAAKEQDVEQNMEVEQLKIPEITGRGSSPYAKASPALIFRGVGWKYGGGQPVKVWEFG